MGINWKPKGGAILEIEMDRSLIEELKFWMRTDGVTSLYQMIRNALYEYIRHRRNEIGGGEDDNSHPRKDRGFRKPFKRFCTRRNVHTNGEDVSDGEKRAVAAAQCPVPEGDGTEETETWHVD